jgi:hypothetical protein
VHSNISIVSDSQLVIEPGVLVRFQTNTSLQVTGILTAVGNVTNPITFTADTAAPIPGDWVGISLISRPLPSIFDHVNVAFAVNGIEIRGDRTRVVVTNAEVHHCLISGILVRADQGESISRFDVDIRANRIYANQNGIFIQAMANSSSSLSEPRVEGNDVFGNVNGILLRASGSPFGGFASADGVISRNRIRENHTGIHGTAGVSKRVSPSCSNNLIINNASNGIDLAEADLSSSSIVNNTISGNGGAGLVHTNFFGFVRNNIFVSNNSGIRGQLPFAMGSPFSFNDVVFNTNGNWINHSADYGLATTTNGNGTPSDFQSNISIPPLFIGNDDYHLHTNSPCVNAGSTGGSMFDYDRHARFSPADIGAFEVTPYLYFRTPSRNGNSILVPIEAHAVRAFDVEGTTNMITWINLATLTNWTDSVTYLDTNENALRFYRAKPRQ